MQTPSPHFLENRVPPLIVALAVAAAMRASVALAPQFSVTWPGREILAWALAIAGLLVAFVGVAAFRSRETTVNPLQPATASRLVDTGIYRRTRNPMYVGVSVSLLGYAVFLSHPLALLASALFPAYIQRFQIAPEERALDRLFGDDYANYKKRVPRWL